MGFSGQWQLCQRVFSRLVRLTLWPTTKILPMPPKPLSDTRTSTFRYNCGKLSH